MPCLEAMPSPSGTKALPHLRRRKTITFMSLGHLTHGAARRLCAVNPRSHRTTLFRALEFGGLYRITNVKKWAYRLIDPP